jgi:hypothetical protein
MEKLVIRAVHKSAKTRELIDIPVPIIEFVACDITYII